MFVLFCKLHSKGLFTRYDFVTCDKLTTGLRHKLFRVNQTYNSLTTLKSCRRPVVSLSHATKSCRVNRPLGVIGLKLTLQETVICQNIINQVISKQTAF